MSEEQRAGNGRERFRKAYAACFSAICAALYLRTGSIDDAEDLAQEIFLRLHRKIDEVENPRAWLYGTMRIVLLDYYKARGVVHEEIEAMIDDAGFGYVNGFREARIVINDVLKDESLYGGDLNRSVFDLVAMNGFSVAEAARHCGVTYRQASYAFSVTTKRVTESLKARGISKLEDLL